MFWIDGCTHLFVEPTFQQIGKFLRTISNKFAKFGTNTSQQIGRIENTHKLIFDVYNKFHGLLYLILFTQNFGTYFLPSMYISCLYI